MAGERQNYGEIKIAARRRPRRGDATSALVGELWVRVESRRRPPSARRYWTDDASARPAVGRRARAAVARAGRLGAFRAPPTNVAGNLGVLQLPGDALNLILADYCDPAAAARAAAAASPAATARGGAEGLAGAAAGLTTPVGKALQRHPLAALRQALAAPRRAADHVLRRQGPRALRGAAPRGVRPPTSRAGAPGRGREGLLREASHANAF